MALTAQPIAPPATSAPAPRHSSDTRAERWRDAITDYLPPAGPDGCWASGAPGVPEQHLASGRS
jgi:hypothetical protein